MGQRLEMSNHERWARFRLTVIGPLLSSPLERGELKAELDRLGRKIWRHPITDGLIRLAPSTMERWYYQARGSTNPLEALLRRIRSDSGTHPSITETAAKAIAAQFKSHKTWSYALHYANLKALERLEGAFDLPVYSTYVRYMRSKGWRKRRRLTRRHTAGAERAAQRFEQREVRSYEAAFPNALWHMDFHVSSRRVLTRDGEWVFPVLCCILDDYSRLCCHAQWYLAEEAENTVHTFMQASLKRGLPRALMTDGGGAVTAEEVRTGLHSLSVTHEPTLPYSPYQNGKQESFWGRVEGRLLAMLEDVKDLALPELGQATAAWLEWDYNHVVHSETGQKPIDRFASGRDLGRRAPSMDILQDHFRLRRQRKQRRSDGTITIDGIRFEVPSRYESLDRIHIRYARWDLSRVHLVDSASRRPVCRLYPQDKQANADGRRRVRKSSMTAVEEASPQVERYPPLLRELLGQYAETGLPPAYLPKDQGEQA
jgi:hypothetical protein